MSGATKGRQYIEFRFHTGLVVSGFVDEATFDEMFRNNAAPSQPLAPDEPIPAGNLAVLLQDQRLREWSTQISQEAFAFHRLDEV